MQERDGSHYQPLNFGIVSWKNAASKQNERGSKMKSLKLLAGYTLLNVAFSMFFGAMSYPHIWVAGIYTFIVVECGGIGGYLLFSKEL